MVLQFFDHVLQNHVFKSSGFCYLPHSASGLVPCSLYTIVEKVTYIKSTMIICLQGILCLLPTFKSNMFIYKFGLVITKLFTLTSKSKQILSQFGMLCTFMVLPNLSVFLAFKDLLKLFHMFHVMLSKF